MLALKLLLSVAGALLLAVALAIPLVPIIHRVRWRRTEVPDGPVAEPMEIPWRGPLALALMACVPLLIASSIVVVGSGMGAVRISQVRGTLPGTLYPGTHFVTPLLETVQSFDLRDHLFTAGVVDGGTKTSAQKTRSTCNRAKA
ncbi:MAG TPA: hypothetical protein VGG85_19600 [Terracidiphilus sp.]|jgi:hypothetical protein